VVVNMAPAVRLLITLLQAVFDVKQPAVHVVIWLLPTCPAS
jgi:hypothetical protein